MNRIKRPCALLLALLLTLGVALQPIIGGAFAEEPEQTEQTAELAAAQIEEPVGEPVEKATEKPTGEPVGKPAEEPVEEPVEEPAEEPVEEPVGEPAEEPVEEPVEEPAEGPVEGPVEAPPTRSFYEWLMCCDSLTALDALMGAEENWAAPEALTQEELAQLLARVEELYAGIAEPTDEDTLLKEALLKKLNEKITVTCPECGKTDGHEETCSQYAGEPVSFPWTDLTDEEFAAWLLDEANAETVKAILSGGSSEGGVGGVEGGENAENTEEYNSLNARVEAILSGGDEALARQVQEYLSALLGLDKPETLAADEYIYFDLALGNVTIGASSYSGKIYANGTTETVSGTRTGSEKFYIYQSTSANLATTGYATETDWTNKENCQVPTYTRVHNGATPWTTYIKNNTKVKEVIDAWAGAAGNSERTPTDYYITFAEASDYTADVVIDNIWSSYVDPRTFRKTGGISAHLGYKTDTKIQLRLKGDNRVGNVHYHARRDTRNQIIFSNGEAEGQTPGSITVADFPDDLDANHWCSAIGGCDDNGHDQSDGIVIEGGEIWAGTTPEDNCTAIGGGGNEYGRVTISGGTVTAVVSSTGTAIGGGIGFGSQGGDADITIGGGEIYAYNLGIAKNAKDIFEGYIPAAAIGGGSSYRSKGNNSTSVTISDGFVYAQCMGGTAIGGGGSATQSGGPATITITGGTVIAKSVSGTFKDKDGNKVTDVDAGASIGGGTGGKNAGSKGGSVELTVSGAGTILRTGSIGGGEVNNGTDNIGSANVTVTGGDIIGQVVMAGGTGTHCTFDMSGGTIHNSNVIDGSVLTVVTDPNPEAIIEYLHDDGGAVWMQDPSGETTISGTAVIENCTANLGGAVYMEGGSFEMSGGAIRSNTARTTFNEDGSIAETGRGGALNMAGGTAEITGGEITGCTAALGGAFYMASRGGSGGTLTMSGGNISGNTATALFDASGNLLETGRGGAINMMGGAVAISGSSVIEDCTANLGGAVYMAAGSAGGHGGTLTMSGGRASRNTAATLFNAAGDFLETGRGGAINMMGGEVTISGDSVIEDCEANLGGAVYMAGGTGGAHGGIFTMTDGTIRGNTANATAYPSGEVIGTGRGGAINMIGGEVNISGGSIEGCTAELGGGVYMANAESSTQGGTVFMAGREDRAQGGTFTMTGGEIKSNTATGTIAENTGRGGGACVYGGNVYLDNGSISGNTAETRGGGFYVTNGDVHVEGGSIDRNYAKFRGGGVFLEDGLFTMENGRVTNNEAGYRGGGLFLTKSPTLTGGVISGNTALGTHNAESGTDLEGSGGGICIKGDELRLENPDMKIFGNEAENGGGVAVLNGAFILDGGNVGVTGEAPNTATRGGGVYVDNDDDATIGSTDTASVTVNSGNIWNNKATDGGDADEGKGNGGGVYLAAGDVNVLGTAAITYNSADKRGGGVYLARGDGKFRLEGEGASISYNTANRGGGAFLYKDPTLNRGTIRGNRANLNGGGLFINECLVTLNSTGAVLITENTAQNGGGILINKLNAESTVETGLTMGSTMEGSIALTNNTATNSGGAVCINNGFFNMASDKVTIIGNSAESGGGVAVHHGDFTMTAGSIGREGSANTATNGGGVYVSGGTIRMESGIVQYNEAHDGGDADEEKGNGGGVYVTGGDVNVTGNAAITHNSADKRGGGVYLARNDESKFRLEGENAIISFNTANRGGGAFLYIDPTLNHGTIRGNEARLNGGGLYVNECLVTLNASKDVIITENTAQNGGGIFINKLHPESGDEAGLAMSSTMEGSVTLTANTAAGAGGGVCVNNGFFHMESDKVAITGNHASTGGGVALHQGQFTMTAGSIGQEGGGNTANHGGGVYVNHGRIQMEGGVVQYNEATDGGGAYVTGGAGENGGWLIVKNGSFLNNTATGNGGGGFAAGDFHMLNGLVKGNNAKNGGGIYIDEGNATIVNGLISYNRASADGGGICITATDAADPITMTMLSGSLSHNQAERYGGGLTVEGDTDQIITVEIGCRLDHHVDITKESPTPTLPLDYTGAYTEYADYYDVLNRHDSCPKVEYNQAGEIGGAVYVDSASATLSFLCAEESNNTTLNPDAVDIEVDGGRVIIGDETYHNYIYDGMQESPKEAPWGYVSMEDPARVDAGQVDLYGVVVNPIFKEDIMVDIQDTTKDHFIDHRLSTNDYRHRIHYYENFQDKGLYRAFQYGEDIKEITVQSALFSRPGYQILGWCTKPVYDPDDENCFLYEVGKKIDFTKDVPGMGGFYINCEFCKGYPPPNLLVLYALWEANGYTVEFDPNVAPGDTYTGSMDAITLTYEVKTALPENKFKYPDYFFTGWNTQPDGSGTAYADKEEVVNLTDQNGATVTLYAQWEICEHDKPERWTYDVIDDDKTLRRNCSCGGQTLTATLSAEDTVYNGGVNPAKLTFSSETDWGEDKLEIVYEKAWLGDDGISHAAGTSPELSPDGKPFHAGQYTATIKKNNVTDAGTEEVKATVTYIIEKAEQKPPEKPTYVLAGDKTKVQIDKLAKDSYVFTDEEGKSHTAKAEYCLTYYGDSGLTWHRFAADADSAAKLELPMRNAYTSYTVQARYAELDDYKPSEIKKADAVYFFAGNVDVIIKCDDGIDCAEVTATGDNPADNGLSLTLSTDTKYYLVSGEYKVTAELKKKADGSTPASQPVVALVPGTDKNKYSVTSIETDSILTITIGTSKKKPQITAQVKPGQIFSPFTGTATTISKDSAFTAAFGVKYFDPAAYECPKLTFSENIPADTTVILLNRGKNGAKTYWHYRAASEVNSVPLSDFKKMGGAGTFAAPAAGEDGYTDLSCQFVVDFSQTGAGYAGTAPLKMTLEAPAKDAAAKAPELKQDVTVSTGASGFNFEQRGTNGLTNRFKYTFAKDAPASKWENRASSLVLTPDSGTVLPPDARIKAVVNGGTTYLYKSGDSFIASLSLLEAEEIVDLTLESALFPPTEESFAFTAQWWISPSKAGKAPMDGDQKGSVSNVIFTSTEKKTPSLKITGESRILKSGQDLELAIQKENMAAEDGYIVSAALLHKLNGIYSGTGWNKSDVSGNNLSVTIGTQNPGSYCLLLTVKQEGSINVVMEVPYYFVISSEK